MIHGPYLSQGGFHEFCKIPRANGAAIGHGSVFVHCTMVCELQIFLVLWVNLNTIIDILEIQGCHPTVWCY